MLQYIDTRYQFLPRWLEEIGNDAPKLCQNFDITYKLNSLTLLAICLVWHSPTWLDHQLRNSFKVNQPTVRPHLLLLLSVRSSRTRRRIKSIGLNLSLENFFFFFTHISIHRFILHSFFQKCTVAKRITNNNNNKTAFIQCLIVVLFCVDWRDVSPQLKQLLLAVRPSQQKNNSTTCPSCASMIFPHLPLSLPTLYLYLTRCHTHTKSLSLALPSAQLFSIHFLSLSLLIVAGTFCLSVHSLTHTLPYLSLSHLLFLPFSLSLLPLPTAKLFPNLTNTLTSKLRAPSQTRFPTANGVGIDRSPIAARLGKILNVFGPKSLHFYWTQFGYYFNISLIVIVTYWRYAMM